MNEIRIALCGIGGYGALNIPPLLNEATAKGARLVAGIDPHPEGCKHLSELKEKNIPIFSSLKDYFSSETCDLIYLCSPIQLHSEQTCLALAHGSHVLCEKPLCATEDEAKAMAEAERLSKKTVTIGYQWSFSPAIQRLKADILAGRFGKPLRFRTLVFWPRDEAYYQRNNWAGRLQDPTGRWVLDSPVNNATAHYLHNMLYVLGPDQSHSAWPAKVEAELFRAHAIPNYDTAALRVTLDSGVPLLFYTSHITQKEKGPLFSYEFEKATVRYTHSENVLMARFHDGTQIDYGTPNDEPYNKLWQAVISARTGSIPWCGIEAARAHTHCVALAQASPLGIRQIPPSLIHSQATATSKKLQVPALDKIFEDCYEKALLPPEIESSACLKA